MRPLRHLILAGCWTVLLAQTTGTMGPTAQMLDRQLRESRVGLLVVVDGPKGEWKAKVDALNSDPEWVDLDLVLLFYGSKAGEVEALLRQKYLAGPRPQWVLFGEGGRPLANGGDLPEPKAMLKVVEGSGVRSRIQVMRDFTRRYPDHLEARVKLCGLLSSKAEKRTLIRVGGKVEPSEPADESYDSVKATKEREAKEEARAQEKQEEKPPVQLGAEEDQAIWGELVDLCARTFRSGEWLEVWPWGLIPPEAAIHSPLMQGMCRATLPEVERVLARNPTSYSAWQVWLGLTRTFGGKPIRPLLDSLVPMPTNRPLAWPPHEVRDAYVKDARKRKDWTGIKDLLLPALELGRLYEASQEQKTD